MANTFNNTLNKVGDAIEALFGSKNNPSPTNPSQPSTRQTCLERFGIEARQAQLRRNEWLRDLQYTKTLVDAEYLIQTEFKVSSYEDRLKEQSQSNEKKQKELSEKEIQKLEKKQKKLQDKLDNVSKTLEDQKKRKENLSNKK